jgi:hypothetical protein
MKRFYYSLLLLALISVLIYLGGRFYFYLTDGFSLYNIKSTSSNNSAWDVPPLSAEDQKIVEKALDQNYYYLGKGCQTYAFVSADGEYVIKFFKHKHLRIDWWWKFIPLPSSFEDFRKQKIKLKRAKLYTLFESAKLAYENLPEETGVIYLHLNKGKTPHSDVIIFDKMGFEHQVNLDKLEFILQKRAYPVYPTIDELVKKSDIPAIQKVFRSLIEVLVLRSQKGIADRDPAMIQNLGLIDDRALIIDIGQFDVDDTIKDPKVYSEDIRKRSWPFIKWLTKNHPELVPYLQQALADTLPQ